MKRRKMAATLIVAALFSMPQIANAVVDTSTYISYETELVPAQSQSTFTNTHAPQLRAVCPWYTPTDGWCYAPDGGNAWYMNDLVHFPIQYQQIGCNSGETLINGVCGTQATVYSCSNGDVPNQDHKCAITSASGKFKPSAIYGKVRDFLGNLLPIVAGFLLLSIAIFLALKTVRRYGKKLI
jgi:hypothetical protein